MTGGVKMFTYFLVFLTVFSGVFGAFRGRPFPGEFFIASKTSGEYKLPLNTGAYPPRNIRWATVLYGRPSVSAISSIVIPVILYISVAILQIFKVVQEEAR
jgi:hypothetical protein